MTLSRRQMLYLLPTAAASVACAPKVASNPTIPSETVVDVRAFGAKGDGRKDDSAAIQAAVRAMRSGNTLYFPAGSYRFAQQRPPGDAAVAISGLSDVNIEFAPGAELLMDNLDSRTGEGTSHGIFIRGPASNITMHNVTIRWSRRAPRSFGDGIRVLGYPTGSDKPFGWVGPPAPVSRVRLSGGDIRLSPQAGAILIGVSDIAITGLRVHGTSADGLHFNACQRATIHDYTGIDTGDDGMALVTYYSEAPLFDDAAQTFAFPDLTEWSNADFTISGVSVSGGRANGVRLAGANRVSLTGLKASGILKGAGLITDSASVVGPATAWRYVASRGIRVDQMSADNCDSGFQLLARPSGPIDPRFTDFDVDLSGATFRDCTNWAVRAESLTTQPATGFRVVDCSVSATTTTEGNGGFGLGNTRDIKVGTVSINQARPVICFSATDSAGLQIDVMRLMITDPAKHETARTPAAFFEDSDGTIESLEVSWPQAPSTWTPIHIGSRDGDCSAPPEALPIVIKSLTVQPGFVMTRVGTC